MIHVVLEVSVDPELDIAGSTWQLDPDIPLFRIYRKCRGFKQRRGLSNTH